MFSFFFIKKPLILQIENYYSWKSIRFPTAAASHKQYLLEFSKFSRVRNVTQIEKEMIQAYLETFNSIGLRGIAANALRRFFQYCKMMGYVSIQLAPFEPTAIMPVMEKIHPLLHVDKVKRVKYLRDHEGLSFRQIKTHMETEDKRKYDIKNIHVWYKKDIPLSTA